MPVLLSETAKPQAAIEGPLAVSQSVGGQPAPQSPIRHGPRQFGPPRATVAEPATPTVVEKPKREKKPKVKADPKLVATARELRDRWLEHVNSGEMQIESASKYDVTRALPDAPRPKRLPMVA
jgi:hypothetical protein